jgi:outer membrane protein OmpA-like peptidoglycan-associated protein
MKHVLALLLTGLLSASAYAAESNIRDLVFKTSDLAYKTSDLVLTVQDLYRIVESTKEITIELPADVLFDFDKAEIRSDAALSLKEVARILREQAKGPVRVEGHTDAKGAAAYNQKLSEQRANSVVQWLTGTEGLASVKFATKGFGATKPAAPNTNTDGSDNPDGRQKNRRVALVFARK